MQKKKFIIAASASILSLTVGVLVISQGYDAEVRKGDASGEKFKITLNKGAITAQEEGLYHQANIRNNKIDLVGWSDNGGDLGSIRKDNYGAYFYNGMIYNRSAINGFESLKVTFTGSPLHYVFTDFLMENMDFDGPALTSGTAVEVPENKAYFIVYNTSETPTNIDSLELTYRCDGVIDNQMIYNKNTTLGGARSLGKVVSAEDSFITLENNPTKTTNNYSRGNHWSSAHDDSWYRWNGKYFTESEELGTEFTFGMTIMGEYGLMDDQTKNFHYNVWPQFSYGNKNDEQWVQTYIGNDNYEPLGGQNTYHPEDPFAVKSYTGRFFGNYQYFGSEVPGGWAFGDPDTLTLVDDDQTSLREAYEKYTLPFWFIKFHVYLDETNNPIADIYINGMFVYSEEIFYYYDKVNTPSIHIKTLPMHLVNYGIDAEGNPDESYTGSFTYPRLIG